MLGGTYLNHMFYRELVSTLKLMPAGPNEWFFLFVIKREVTLLHAILGLCPHLHCTTCWDWTHQDHFQGLLFTKTTSGTVPLDGGRGVACFPKGKVLRFLCHQRQIGIALLGSILQCSTWRVSWREIGGMKIGDGSLPSLKRTNRTWKMDGWKEFLLKWPILRAYVSLLGRKLMLGIPSQGFKSLSHVLLMDAIWFTIL